MCRPRGFMKSQNRATHLLLWLCLFMIVAPGFTEQQMPKVTEEARDFKIFSDRVQEYVKMQRELKASLPPLNPTNDAAQIIEHQQALAGKIAEARRSAHQGDIFTSDVRERFHKIIDRTFHGPEGRIARETIRPDGSFRPVRLHVNDVCSEKIPSVTMPPTLLLKLPELPQELTYRIVGFDLTLQDTEARLIVDLIPNAIR
jgi:hypothetical protein